MAKLGSILFVDDDEVSNFLGATVMRTMNVARQVTLSTDAGEALELVAKESIDIVLLDINMPVMTGFEFLDALRQLEETEHIVVPAVFMLTSSTNQMDRTKAEQYPMVKGYLTKPLTEEDVDYLVGLITEGAA